MWVLERVGVAVLLTCTCCSSGPGVPTQIQIVTGQARVSQVDVAILESFPVQVHVMVTGELADACTSLGTIEQSRAGNRFTLNIETARPMDAICAQVLGEFQEVVPLDVFGLPRGTYLVDVNGVVESFTLAVDNLPQR